MKIKRNIKRLIILSFFLTFCIHSFSQKRDWSLKINSLKSFIENNGQYADINGKKVLYAYLDNNEKFYFTDKGLIIKLDTIINKKPLAKKILNIFEKENEVERKYNKIISYCLNAEWQNVNLNITIETSEKTEGYYTFGLNNGICNGYKKITYKNIYPNIDIEYTIPNDSAGVKYNIILHPEADVSDIALKYSGDITEMLSDNNGNIIIKTPLHNIVEHAPKSYYSDASGDIASSYILKDNLITFFVSSTNQDKTIIIDPWVSGLLMSGDDWGYDVDYDWNNNLYVYIHDYTSAILCIKKYSSSGTLFWTHLPAVSNADYEGNFIVDRLTNTIYICDGYNLSGATAYRISDNGVADGFVSQQSTSLEEIWDLVFDCNLNRIIGLGGGTQGNINGGLINPITGTVSIANFTGLPGAGQDISCNAVDAQGNVFVVYANSSFGSNGHLISQINSTLNGNVWQVNHGMSGFQELLAHCPNDSCTYHSNAFNGLAVNDNYLYYYDGGGLAAYNKSTGAQIAATSVGYSGTWYTALYQGGIAVDDCNNVYVGGPNSNILMYSFDGTSFTQLGNMPLGWTGNQSVFDIKYDFNTKYLYVSGHSNVGVFEAPIPCLTSINENNITNENNIQVYPNPANDYTVIKWVDAGNCTIEILDITGKLIKVFENLNSGELNVNTEKFDKGIYTIKLTDENNLPKGTVKLIVK